MPIFYHGTDYMSGHNIIRKGFGLAYERDKVWGCADQDYTYLWKNEINRVIDGRGQACSSALLTAAAHDSPNTRVIILKIEVPKCLMKYFSADGSSDQEAEEYAVKIETSTLNRYINSGKIKLSFEAPKIYKPEFRLFYLVDTGCTLQITQKEKDLRDIAEEILPDCGSRAAKVLFWDTIDNSYPIYHTVVPFQMKQTA